MANPFIGTLTLSAALGMLVGCGGSQTPFGAPGAMQQGPAIATHAAHGNSWSPQGPRKGDLLYVSSSRGYVYRYTYPRVNASDW